jgi:hypothetical protein
MIAFSDTRVSRPEAAREYKTTRQEQLTHGQRHLCSFFTRNLFYQQRLGWAHHSPTILGEIVHSFIASNHNSLYVAQVFCALQSADKKILKCMNEYTDCTQKKEKKKMYKRYEALSALRCFEINQSFHYHSIVKQSF